MYAHVVYDEFYATGLIIDWKIWCLKLFKIDV